MTRQQIETRIAYLQSKLASETHPSTLAMLNRCIERLIMMQPDDEPATAGEVSDDSQLPH